MRILAFGDIYSITLNLNFDFLKTVEPIAAAEEGHSRGSSKEVNFRCFLVEDETFTLVCFAFLLNDLLFCLLLYR